MLRGQPIHQAKLQDTLQFKSAPQVPHTVFFTFLCSEGHRVLFSNKRVLPGPHTRLAQRCLGCAESEEGLLPEKQALLLSLKFLESKSALHVTHCSTRLLCKMSYTQNKFTALLVLFLTLQSQPKGFRSVLHWRAKAIPKCTPEVVRREKYTHVYTQTHMFRVLFGLVVHRSMWYLDKNKDAFRPTHGFCWSSEQMQNKLFLPLSSPCALQPLSQQDRGNHMDWFPEHWNNPILNHCLTLNTRNIGSMPKVVADNDSSKNSAQASSLS